MAKPRSARAATALLHLPQIDPMLAALSVWCDTTDADSDETVTSGDTICVGRAFSNLPLREQIGLLGHHILHIVLRHEYELQDLQTRDGSAADAELFGLCADSFINECLLRGGHALPRPAVRLSELRHATGHSEALSDAALARVNLHDLYQDALRNSAQARDYAAKTGFRPDVKPDAAALKSDRSAARWRTRVLRASQGAGAAGRGVGSVLSYLDGIPSSQTPWERHLRGLLVQATNPVPRRSFRRPRARWIAAEADARLEGTAHPAFEPAQDRSALRPRLVVAVDASSSVDRRQLSRFAAEVIAIAERTDAETHVLCFDEVVFAHRQVEREAAHRAFEDLPFHRDGGTSFVDVIGQADALRPSLIILLTDMQGAFGSPPLSPVLWASSVPAPPTPPFGDVLELIW